MKSRATTAERDRSSGSAGDADIPGEASRANETASAVNPAALPAADRAPGVSAADELLRGAGAPLTEAQAGLWFAQRLDPANPVFNTAHLLEIEGPLDVPGFAAAVDETMREADALSIRFIDDADGVRQVIDERSRPRLEVIDLRGVAGPRAHADAAIRRDIATPIDLVTGPLAIERLYRLGDDLHLWYQRVHHIAVDGFGTHLLIRGIRERYTARLEGRMPAAAAIRPFADLLDAEAAYRASPKREADRAYWLARFVDRPDAGAIKPGAATTADHYLTRSVVLPGEVGPLIRRLGEGTGTPWPDVASALVIAYLHRLASAPEIVTGVAAMNRLGTGAARIPAMVMNILPVRTAVDEEAPLGEFVARVGSDLRTARKHGGYRGEQLRRDLGMLGESRRLYGAIVNVLPYDEPTAFPGLRVTERALATGPVDDLSIEVRGGGPAADGAILLEIQANPRRYAEDEVGAHVARLAAFIANAARAERLADVPTVTPEEHQRWIFGVNDTARAVEETTLAALIERSMKEHAGRTALRFAGAPMTYAELDWHSAIHAAELAESGIGANDVVAVALERSFELLVRLVAILRAGAAYLPLDPDSPPERVSRILASARPKRVITDTRHAAIFPPGAPIEYVDAASDGSGRFEGSGRIKGSAPPAGGGPAADLIDPDPSAPGWSPSPSRESRAPAPPPPAPRDAAYVIYTSGSTGEPKGVVVEHEAIVNRLLWMRAHYGITADDVILQKTPVTFDVSVWELFLPMLAGATLVIAPPGAHRDPAALAAIIRDEGVTTLHFVPSMLAVFLEEPAAATCRPRRVFCSGEALTAALRDRFHATLDAELHNLYGPTEAAVDVTWWDASAGDDSDPVPIGFPVWNTRMYVLDGRMRPVPPGVAGDLYIGGTQLARGYLSRPDLTDDRFVPHPFLPAPARVYRTGDVAEWRPDGAILFHGRSDFQVKIRGFRIELGEIEAALLDRPEIGRAVVIARKHEPGGDGRIVAYLVPASGGMGGGIDIGALREALAARLPDYMIPSAFVIVDDLPLTTSGKLDRAALPDPGQRFAADAADRAPATPTERALAGIFAEVLGREAVGADEDFFLIGGHSLLAARVAARVRVMCGVEVGLGAVFAHPTVARLARRIETLVAGTTAVPGAPDDGLGPVVALRRGDGTRSPVFCIHPAGGISWCYRALAGLLREDRDVYGLQAVGLDPDTPLPDRLDEMAADYVRRVVEIAPDGPYHLVGWSVGGIIAQAMAVALANAGRPVGLVAMLDAYPADCWRDEPEPDEAAALDALLHIAGHGRDVLSGEALTRESVKAALRRLGHPLGELTDRWINGVVRVVERNARLVRVHQHERFDGPILHFRAALDHAGTDFHPRLWAPWAAVVEIVEIEATHPRMIQGDSLRAVARTISERLSSLD